MNYKSIVVHLDASDQAHTRLDQAMHLAHRHKAHLTGVYALFEPEPGAFFVVGGTADYYLQARKAREARQIELKHRFEHETARLSVSSDWLSASRAANLTMQGLARHADLVIAGPNVPTDPETYIDVQFQENLVLSSGRPVLFVPRAGRHPSLGKRVLIAWDGSRAATRAAHDALPFLQHAKQITVLTVSDSIDPRLSLRIPGADAALMLARHVSGVQVVNVIDTSSTSVGDTLLSRASDCDADLLVMGGYGHERWHEQVMGGTTRTVLASMTLPVLMSH